MFFTLLKHTALRADSRARANTGKTIAARIPMIAMTTSNSIRVKPFRLLISVAPLGARLDQVDESPPYRA
jgi:hypothetical protein